MGSIMSGTFRHRCVHELWAVRQEDPGLSLNAAFRIARIRVRSNVERPTITSIAGRRRRLIQIQRRKTAAMQMSARDGANSSISPLAPLDTSVVVSRGAN